MLSGFLVQLAMYTCLMVAGNMHLDVDDIRKTGLHVRTLIAVYQVVVVSLLLSLQTIFLFFIKVVQKDKISFVLVSRKSEIVMGLSEQYIQEDESLPETPSQSNVQQRRKPNELKNRQSSAEDEWKDNIKQENDSHEQTLQNSMQFSRDLVQHTTHMPSVCTETRSVNLSVDSELMPANIIFENNTNLDLYVLYVNLVGLVLWDTFVCFNFATYDSCFVLVGGFVSGWICNNLSKECRCHDSQAAVVRGQKVFFLFYLCMFLLVMALCTSTWEAPQDLTASRQINLYVPAFLSGVFWTAISTEVAFTGVANEQWTKGILYDSRRALPTFLLVACVSALYSSPDTRNDVHDYIGGLSRAATIHLLLFEPAFMFVGLYVMVIALEKQRSTDFTLVMVLVQGVASVSRSSAYDAVAVTTIVACVMLLFVHVSRLVRAPYDTKAQTCA